MCYVGCWAHARRRFHEALQEAPVRSDSPDAALIATLAPGNHSVQVSNANGSTGLSLVEVYEMP